MNVNAIVFAFVLVACSCQGVTFRSDPYWQTGQYILYDEPYLSTVGPLNYNITFDVAINSTNVGVPVDAGVAIAGI